MKTQIKTQFYCSPTYKFNFEGFKILLDILQNYPVAVVLILFFSLMIVYILLNKIPTDNRKFTGWILFGFMFFLTMAFFAYLFQNRGACKLPSDPVLISNEIQLLLPRLNEKQANLQRLPVYNDKNRAIRKIETLRDQLLSIQRDLQSLDCKVQKDAFHDYPNYQKQANEILSQ